MKDLNLIIAENIIKLRKKSNMTQNDLAKKLNYSNKMISKWENGDNSISLENLCAISKIFNVSLDKLVKPLEDEDVPKIEKKQISNKVIISLLAISAVWIIATICFVYSNIINNTNLWTIFVWSVPASCIVGLVFNSLWGNKKFNYVIISVLVWSLTASIYLQFLKYNLFPIFFIGIPVQVSIIIWSGLTTKKTKSK